MVGKCKKQCVHSLSTCNVTERISFVNSFAAAFRKGVLEFVWIL